MRPLDSLCLFPHQRNGNISASEGSCKAQTRFRSDCLSKGYQDRALLLQLGAQRSCAWWPPRVTRPRPGQEEVQERAWMGATQTQVQLTQRASEGASENQGYCGVLGASRDSTGYGAMEEGLISS